MVPIRHTTYEPELTVGSGIRCVTGPEFDGGSDLGYNRMNFRWGNVGTFQISPGSHMWQVVNKYYKADEPVPITMCFGVPPACTLLAGAGFDYAVLPMGCDEIGIAGAVQGAPDPPGEGAHRRRHGARRLPSWCWKATSIRATAASRPRSAEDAGVQGRFHFHPEWAGYMGKAYKAPTFHVTARHHAQAARPSRSSSRSACTRSTTTTSTPRCARRRSTSCASGCSPASCRTW